MSTKPPQGAEFSDKKTAPVVETGGGMKRISLFFIIAQTPQDYKY